MNFLEVSLKEVLNQEKFLKTIEKYKKIHKRLFGYEPDNTEILKKIIINGIKELAIETEGLTKLLPLEKYFK